MSYDGASPGERNGVVAIQRQPPEQRLQTVTLIVDTTPIFLPFRLSGFLATKLFYSMAVFTNVCCFIVFVGGGWVGSHQIHVKNPLQQTLLVR